MSNNLTNETIHEYIKKCHEAAKENGWWDDLPDDELLLSPWLADKLDLIASEGSEAVEAIRSGRYASMSKFGYINKDLLWDSGPLLSVFDMPWYFEKHIKDTFEDEIADIFIRACDMMGYINQGAVGSAYNTDSTRDIIRSIRIMALSGAETVKNNSAYGALMVPCELLSNILFKCIIISDRESFDLKRHVDLKLEYNKTRGKKHGKKF